MKYGNVKQVAAFGKLVGICNDLGASYNPSKATLSSTALVTLLEQAQQKVEAVNVARTQFLLAVNARQESFAALPAITSRMVRALAATESSAENIRDARILRQRLSSNRFPKQVTASVGSDQPTVKTRSISRLDFESQADSFSKLIQLVQRIPDYAPNEVDLQVSALTNLLTELKLKTQQVAKAANEFATVRIERNKVLAGKNGMYETAAAVKEYIRSVFGVRSEAARELGKLKLVA